MLDFRLLVQLTVMVCRFIMQKSGVALKKILVVVFVFRFFRLTLSKMATETLLLRMLDVVEHKPVDLRRITKIRLSQPLPPDIFRRMRSLCRAIFLGAEPCKQYQSVMITIGQYPTTTPPLALVHTLTPQKRRRRRRR